MKEPDLGNFFKISVWRPTLVEFSCKDNLVHVETKYQQNMVALFAE